MERFGAPAWLGSALIVGAALLGSTWWWVGAGDVVAVIAAAIAGASGVAAAWRRRQIDALPLEIASVAAVGPGTKGPGITVRAWLGRGRRIEAVEVVARMDGATLPVLVHPGPLVGRFQAVVTGLPEDQAARTLDVEVRARAEGREWSVHHSFPPDTRREGRFAAGITTKGGVGWDPARWPLVE